MPAVTVEDTTVLPRVPVPAPGTVRRRVRSVTTAPSGFEGEGFPVRRAFAGVDLRDLDPFIHMDQMGEVRSEEHTSELQSRQYLVCRLLLEKKKNQQTTCSKVLFHN